MRSALITWRTEGPSSGLPSLPHGPARRQATPLRGRPPAEPGPGRNRTANVARRRPGKRGPATTAAFRALFLAVGGSSPTVRDGRLPGSAPADREAARPGGRLARAVALGTDGEGRGGTYACSEPEAPPEARSFFVSRSMSARSWSRSQRACPPAVLSAGLIRPF